MIDPKAKQILENAFIEAMNDLMIPPMGYSFCYEKIGNQRFKSMENAEEVDSTERIVFINEDWANDRVKTYPIDLFYLMAHEARHVYQHIQVDLFRSGRSLRENVSLVVSWMDNFQHYTRNEGGDSVIKYYRQPVEVDADAYASFFLLKRQIGQARFPPESEDLVFPRFTEIAEQFGMSIVDPDAD